MKGMALEYVFVISVVVVFIIVVIGILTNFIKPDIIPRTDHVDVKYACVQYNETKIGLENLKTLLYGFLTGQCEYFVGELRESVTVDDLDRVAKEIDKNVDVIALTSCEQPTVSAHNLYVCCSKTLEKNKIFNITRKEIKNSDVLICQ